MNLGNPKVICSERVIMCDVDDTLVMHDLSASHEAERMSVLNVGSLDFAVVIPNRPMIQLVKEEKLRGSIVIVWSKGGYEWAANVVYALGLETYVDVIMSKPAAYFDDKEASTWLTDRVYLTPGTPYKNIREAT